MGFVVAVDGPAASGKGVLSEKLGRRFGWPVLDTGMLYRAVALRALEAGVDLEDGVTLANLAAFAVAPPDDERLRDRAVGEAASRVAAHEGVRAALVDAQRRFAAQEPGAILDGRDIGTVICPVAPAKIFVTATAAVRAERRWRQLAATGVTLAEVLADIEARDRRDASRAAAPMRPAPDAVLLDTTHLDIDAAFDAALRIVEAARGGRRS